MVLEQLLNLATEAANASRQVISKHLNKTKVLTYKGKTDLVTSADEQSEKIIIVDTPDWGPGLLDTLPYRNARKGVFPIT